ncbi:hypothetical protein B0H63DRAFT_224555 [Podospora didyma]|uniref:cyclin-dependent kinase n=1 Tax=Podospora didyma TaxID=330526 RepID=A0AAE0KJN8_9PEZI|nr:hypothetical protein B0H63DRAFT_224555 [Podospora didyma]
MEFSAPYRRRHHDATKPNGRRRHRDFPRNHQDGTDLGMTTSRRSISPANAAVNRTPNPDSAARERERPATNRPIQNQRSPRPHDQSHPHPGKSKPRRRSPEPHSRPPPPPPPSHLTQHRSRHERDRSPGRPSRPDRPPYPIPRGRRESSRDLPRGRDSAARSSSRRRPDPGPSPGSLGPRGREAAYRPQSPSQRPQRASSRSPLPPNHSRRRSPNLSLAGPPPSRKSRPTRSLKRPEKGTTKPPFRSKDYPGASPDPRRSRSPEYRDQHSKPPQQPGPSRSPAPHLRRRARSPGDDSSLFPAHNAPRQRSSSPRYRDRSLPNSRLGSRSRPRSPPALGSRPPTASDTGSHRRPSPDPGARAPPSPRDRRRPKLSKKGRTRDDLRLKKFDPASGANSIEVNMAARGGFRGGFNSQQQQPGYPSKGQYNHSHSSGHGTPNSSYHGSPPAQSPFGGNGRSWNGQQQYSPQSQYGPSYSHNNNNNYGPPTGPQGAYHSNSPPYPPNGPSSQYSSGPYRGGHRGGSGGFRGGTGRGGQRGNFKSTQWNSNAPGGATRSQPASGDEPDTSQASAHPSPNNHPELAPDSEDVPMEDGDNPFRPSKDLQVEDTSKEDQAKEEQMPPPSRPPPTGPQSQTPNKFSFSMKTVATKAVVTGPRPEISSKFNAAPPSTRDTPQKPAPKATPPKATPPRPDRDRGGGFPKNVPTAPASSRSRPSERRPPEPSRRAEPPPPRTRKVKKMMKRLKEKPVLPPDLAKSKSVFFRKPGNESVIGSGTYGKVFKGLNVYTKRLVALKRIRMEGERDGFPVTAVREIKLLRSLSHKNIVRLEEVMVETNECFMVFEYLAHDLTGLLNHPNFTLEPAQKKDLAKQLFEGLDYLHTRGVLHRDIKAANILVSNEGVLKLADFGLARFYAKHHQLDYTNRVITIWYRSPELLLGETQYGPAVDIWSAACVLMEIFTKRAIFPGDGSEISQLEKIHAVLGTPNRTDWPNLIEMPWFELLRPTYRKPNVFEEMYKDKVTPAAFDLLAAMFRYDPAKRPTAAEVLSHAYFTSEEPSPRQAIELKDIDGEWHEFESKALRRENEKKDKEARRMLKEAAAANPRDRKRPNESNEVYREAKRPHVDVEGKLQKADQDHELDPLTGKLQPAKVQNHDAQPPSLSQAPLAPPDLVGYP